MNSQAEQLGAINFANSMRGKYIISQALNYAIKHLRKLENRKNPYPKNGEHAEPSNRTDMEYLERNIFPIYAVTKEMLNESSFVQKEERFTQNEKK